MFGAWTAYKLRQDGASVLLLDAYGPGNSRSSSGGETRVILICDIWSPYLSVEEREAIGKVIAATDAFNQTQATSQI